MPGASSKRRLALFAVPFVLIAGAAQIYLEGTSGFPWNWFRKPRHDESITDAQRTVGTLSAIEADRDIFLAKSMPLFLAHLERQRRMDIRYKSQVGTDQRLLIFLNEANELVAEQDMAVGTATEVADGRVRPMHITLIDRNRDGRLDLARYQMGSDVPKVFESPRDEASVGLWNLALSVAFTTNRCCDVGGSLPSNKFAGAHA